MPPRASAPWLYLILIVLGGVALRLVFFAGYVGTDDQYYILAAYRISAGDLGAFTSRWAVRSATVMPTALFFRMLGVSPATAALWPLLCSVCETIVTFLLGRRLFDTRVGLLAACLLAIFPLDVIFSSELFACVPTGMLCGFGLYFFVRDGAAQRPLSLFCSGVAFGLAALAGDTALFCLLPVGIFFIFYARRRRAYIGFATGLILVVGAECVLYALLAGDPWRRWHILSAAIAVQGEDALSSGLGFAYLTQPFLRLLSEQEFGLFPYLLVPAIIFHLRRRSGRAGRFLVVWVAVIFLYTAYGTVSPFRFAPLPRLPRYSAPMTVAVMVLLASYLISLRAAPRTLMLVLLLVTSLAGVVIDNGRARRAIYRDLRQWITTQPQQRVVVESGEVFDVLFYGGFQPLPNLGAWARTDAEASYLQNGPPLFASLPRYRSPEKMRGALVAVDSAAGREGMARFGHAEPLTVFQPPDRLYYRLLRNPLFLRVLAVTRDNYRMQGLEALPREHIEVYRIPG